MLVLRTIFIGLNLFFVLRFDPILILTAIQTAIMSFLLLKMEGISFALSHSHIQVRTRRVDLDIDICCRYANSSSFF